MCRSTHFAIVIASLAVVACDTPSEPEPHADISPPAAQAAGVHGGSDVRLINMKDACDPTSFGEAGVACLRNGAILFDKFINQLGRQGIMRARHLAPSVVHAKVGETPMAVNRGGEEHTFTEVEEFGGGIVPALNALSGNPEVAPECLALAADDFIEPGAGNKHYVKRLRASSKVGSQAIPVAPASPAAPLPSGCAV
ncbi:MAG TPA: hypothetical protein VJQ44_18340 [Gemmatimonadales bacterium]|nr:hypothetical protein [Gemmatimonadales bacterium]